MAELAQLGRQAMDLIGRIDGFNRHRLAESPELAAAWKSAKAVVGPLTRRPEEETPPPGGQPEGPTARAS